jgi:hypothetical protein
MNNPHSGTVHDSMLSVKWLITNGDILSRTHSGRLNTRILLQRHDQLVLEARAQHHRGMLQPPGCRRGQNETAGARKKASVTNELIKSHIFTATLESIHPARAVFLR